MKRMLFNATHPEELRVAIVDGQQLINLDIESAVRAEKKGNIYKAVVTRVEPGLEAAFVEYGTSRQGFLPLKDIHRDYFTGQPANTSPAQSKIAEVVREGQEMTVQVSKDERGGKGAALTTFISLAGRFLVLMPNNPKKGGISRRVSGEERLDLRQILANLEGGEQHALIARTAGLGRSAEELQWDLDFLLKLWKSLEEAAADLKAPRLIYQESNLIVRSLRDYLADDIAEIIVDEQEIHERAQRFMQQVMPHNLAKLKYHSEPTPLFSRFQIEHQIEAAFQREMRLPSGGAIVIDHTEALVAIDINSARATKGADIEETALQTNLEAVDEIARQLRVRDLGGLVVMDLIDMASNQNQRAVEMRLHNALKLDRARTQVGRISRFSLLEMSRQRLRASISDANYRDCPRCQGNGTIRSVVSASLSVLRLLEEKALQESTEALQVILPLDMAAYLLNEKRYEVSRLESRLASRIIIIPSEQLSSPHFQIKRLRGDEVKALGELPSYQQPFELESDQEEPILASLKPAVAEKPHIHLHQIKRDKVPTRFGKGRRQTTGARKPRGGGLFSRLLAGVRNAFGGRKAKPRASLNKGKASAANASRAGNNRRAPQSQSQQQRSRTRGGRNPNAASGNRAPQPRRNSGAQSGAGKPRGNVRSSQPRANQAGQASHAKRSGNIALAPVTTSARAETPQASPAKPPRQTSATQQAQRAAEPSNPGAESPPPTTRRDFAAHNPSQRVGHRAPKNLDEPNLGEPGAFREVGGTREA